MLTLVIGLSHALTTNDFAAFGTATAVGVGLYVVASLGSAPITVREVAGAKTGSGDLLMAAYATRVLVLLCGSLLATVLVSPAFALIALNTGINCVADLVAGSFRAVHEYWRAGVFLVAYRLLMLLTLPIALSTRSLPIAATALVAVSVASVVLGAIWSLSHVKKHTSSARILPGLRQYWNHRREIFTLGAYAALDGAVSRSDVLILSLIATSSVEVAAYVAAASIFVGIVSLVQGVAQVYLSHASSGDDASDRPDFRLIAISAAAMLSLVAMAVVLGSSAVVASVYPDAPWAPSVRGPLVMLSLSLPFVAVDRLTKMLLVARHRSHGVLLAQAAGTLWLLVSVPSAYLLFGLGGAAGASGLGDAITMILVLNARSRYRRGARSIGGHAVSAAPKSK